MADSKAVVEALRRLRMRLADGADFVTSLRDAHLGDNMLGAELTGAIARAGATSSAVSAMADKTLLEQIALVDRATVQVLTAPIVSERERWPSQTPPKFLILEYQ